VPQDGKHLTGSADMTGDPMKTPVMSRLHPRIDGSDFAPSERIFVEKLKIDKIVIK
jgi:hypothetical protein